MTLPPGSFLGRYRIITQLGAGGMGEVYEAEDTRLGRRVALKCLPDPFARDRATLERFEREARAASALSHPHICTLYDIAEADGRPYLAMELLEGRTLKERLQGRPLPIAEIVDLGLQLADALEAAHAKRIVHRDIKPANVFLTTRGTAKLLDFGLAKPAAAPQAPPEAPTVTGNWATGAGLALGTVGYMSPEQVRGEALDVRTDLFSLGVVLYESATGTAPFRGATSGAVLGEILNAAPAAPVHLNPEVPPELERILNKLLEKDRALRYQSAADLHADLERLKRGGLGTKSGGGRAVDASIVVLPFANLSSDPEQDYFSDGLTQELIADLSKVRMLRVISRTSAMKFKGMRKGVPEIARELNVRHVLEGSVRKAGNNLRITAQLIDATTEALLWAEKYAGTMDDVFVLQEQLSRRIVEALKVALAPDEDRRLAAHVTSDPRAYDVWLRARHEAYRLTKEGVETAIRLTEQGRTALGEHALLDAADGVFHYYLYDFGFDHTERVIARAEASAARALDLDPELSLAWFAKGLSRYKRGDLPAFVRHLKRSLELERSADALFFLAFMMAVADRPGDARRYADEAVERDPLTWLPAFARSVVELYDGQFETAVTRCRDWSAREGVDPSFGQWWLGQVLAHAGLEDEAVAAFERGVGLGSGVFPLGCDLGRLAFTGDLERTRQWFESGDEFQALVMNDEIYPWFVADCFARVGDFEVALRWVGQAITWGFANHRFLAEHDRFLAPLRGDPRFDALMARAREKRRAFEAS